MPEAVLVKKSTFAEMRGVSHERVRQSIAQGKIGRDAIVGEGPRAKIDFDLATAHLRERLNVDQRFSNGLATNLERGSSPAQLALALGDSVEAQIKAEKLRQAQLMTSRLEEEDRLRRGLYIETKDARGEMMRIASDLLGSFEGSLVDLSSEIAAEFRLPGRDVLHILRRAFRRVRERLAAAHAANAASDPQRTVEAVESEPGSVQ